jgi:hypothetical protein
MRQLRPSDIKLLFGLLFMKLFITCLFIIVTGCLSGCKTGGKWVKPASPNVKVISPNDLIKNPNGTYSLKNGNPVKKKEKVSSKDIPQVINKPQKTKNRTVKERVETKGFKTSPTLPANSSVKPQHLPSTEAKSSGENSPLDPTKNVVDIRMNVTPKNNPPNSKGKLDKSIDTVIIEEQEMKIDWMGLLMFYFIAIMALIITWMIYDLIKDFLYNKKTTDRRNPFKEKQIKNNSNRRKARRRRRKTQEK